jgi:hypothetical protein
VYDADQQDGGQDHGGHYDSEEDAMCMSAILVTLLAQLSRVRSSRRYDETSMTTHEIR